MSMNPADNVPPEIGVETAENPPPQPDRKRWGSRVLLLCFAIFTFEVGLFLVIFPWQDSWTFNYFQGLNETLESLWDEPYFRGALTGLGFVNIYIALLQVIRLFRRG